MGGAMVIGRTAHELERRGHAVALFAEAEGKGSARFDALGLSYERIGSRADIVREFNRVSPDIALVGLASPRFLEAEADEEAALRSIPIVHIDDYWGTSNRSLVTPDLVVTIDAWGVDLVHRKHPITPVVTAGFSALDGKRHEPMERLEELRRRRIRTIVFPDGGPHAESCLRVLVASLEETLDVPWRLIPKFHPKFVRERVPGRTETWGDRYEAVIAPLRARGLIVDCPEPTDRVAAGADAVASSYSSLLFAAAAKGKWAITLWTREAIAFHDEETGIRDTPLTVRRKDFPVLTAPASLDGVLKAKPSVLDLKPFDPGIAASAVEKLLCDRRH